MGPDRDQARARSRLTRRIERYVVLERVLPGPNIARALAIPIPLAHVLTIAANISAALHHAHSANRKPLGIVHCGRSRGGSAS
jgi:hypothetical protein